jgi:hypothetical protein
MVAPYSTERSVVIRRLPDCQVPGEKERVLQKLHSNHAVWSYWSIHFFRSYLNRYELQLLKRPFELWDRVWTSSFWLNSLHLMELFALIAGTWYLFAKLGLPDLSIRDILGVISTPTDSSVACVRLSIVHNVWYNMYCDYGMYYVCQ